MCISMNIIVAMVTITSALGGPRIPPSSVWPPKNLDCGYLIKPCTSACEKGSDRINVVMQPRGNGAPCPTTTADCTPGMGQCSGHCESWSGPIVGSIASHNIECFADKSVSECQQLCESDSDCLSIDVRNSDNHCCLGTCRIGDGCENDDDTNWTYYECVPYPEAKPLTCGAHLTGSTAGNPNQFGNSAGDSIYEFVADRTSYTFDGCLTTDYDLYLSIYDSDRNELHYNDDHKGDCPSGSPSLASHLVANDLQIGQKYYLVVDGFSSNEGSYDVDVSCTSESSGIYRDCMYTMTPCTTDCESGWEREITILMPASGEGIACPTQATNCVDGEDECGAGTIWGDGNGNNGESGSIGGAGLGLGPARRLLNRKK